MTSLITLLSIEESRRLTVTPTVQMGMKLIKSLVQNYKTIYELLAFTGFDVTLTQKK